MNLFQSVVNFVDFEWALNHPAERMVRFSELMNTNINMKIRLKNQIKIHVIATNLNQISMNSFRPKSISSKKPQ